MVQGSEGTFEESEGGNKVWKVHNGAKGKRQRLGGGAKGIRQLPVVDSRSSKIWNDHHVQLSGRVSSQ